MYKNAWPKRMRLSAFGLGGVLLVSLCGCATTYHSKGATGGFTESQISGNFWRVNFRGNGFTGDQRSKDFALLRCAELTLQKGFSHFILVDANTVNAANPWRALLYSPSALVPQPSSTNTILMFDDKPNVDGGTIYDANEICSSIGKKYNVQCRAAP